VDYRFCLGIVLDALITLAGVGSAGGAPQAVKATDAAITVRYTDVRKAAGITFVQDSTQTD
jgi:hypothetical protein